MTISLQPNNDLSTRVRAFAHAEGLWSTGAMVVAAVSGGPDSLALLELLVGLADEEGLRLAVGHVNHGLREEATADAEYVADLATRHGLPFRCQQVDVRGRVAATGDSVEMAARFLRYAALTAIAEELGATYIATGHTANDQAETVLMRVLRGTGITGLAGIPPRRGMIIRPLLPVWREEIDAFLAARALIACQDLSNLSPDFLRNRLRRNLLPLLETDYAPRVREHLVHLATLARDDDAALNTWAQAAYDAHHRLLPRGGVLISPLPELPPAVQRRVWRLTLAVLRGQLEEISFTHLREIENLPIGHEVHLPGVRVRHEQDGRTFFPVTEAPAPATPAASLPVPGRLIWSGSMMTAEVVCPPVTVSGGDIGLLDLMAIRGPLIVRNWQPGDRFRPLGAPGSRKVQDIFVDAGVPRRLRAQVPVVQDNDGIVWIAGFRIADRVKMQSTSFDVLRLTITWEWNPWTSKLFNNLP